MQIWKDLKTPEFGAYVGDLDGKSIGLFPLLKDILELPTGHVAEWSANLNIKLELSEDLKTLPSKPSFFQYLEEKGGRLVYDSAYTDFQYAAIFLWNNGIVKLDCANAYVSIDVLSQDPKLVKEIKEHFNSLHTPLEVAGHIFSIVQNGPSLSLQSLGNAGIKLEAGNYSPKVIEDYRFTIQDLRSDYPSGRITIMRGTPGTGKTHLVRAMLLEVPDAMFVIVSPEVITTLAGPQLLPLLMQQRGGMKGPIILVLEDADKCLVARDNNNIHSIQALLNLGDGIIGSMLDLRIVATTNAKELQMDEAITRDGRLSKMMEVGTLDATTVCHILHRLLPDKKQEWITDLAETQIDMTLAKTYKLARHYGWLPKTRSIEEKTDEEFDEDI